MKTKVISIDFQNDFTSEGGVCYRERPSVDFIKGTLVPFLEKENIKIAEIISDYRQPRPGDRGDCCHPGEWGYESQVPASVKDENVWIKCMNSPIWIRENIGDQSKAPGIPYQDPKKFTEWLEGAVGNPDEVEIVLIGLTLDCCVLCAAQELNFRGYKVKILKEAVDTYSGVSEDKESICKIPVDNWADIIEWSDLEKQLTK